MMTYYVEKTDKIVDGNTFCDGRKCTSADTIIIRGGARSNLLIRNFDGSGSYIPIINENGTSRVEITNDASVGYGVLNLLNCKYVDLGGNNNEDFKYGIHVRNCEPARAHAVWVYGESDHIKLDYLEVDCIGNTSMVGTGCGIHVGDRTITDAWIYDTFEIHHNYIHDTRYAGMYLGHNWPRANKNPYVGSFSIHDNLLEDMGSYGITFKGVKINNNYIYNNTIRRTGLVFASEGSAWQGIGVQMLNSGCMVEIYDNRIEHTLGSGLKIGGGVGNLIHHNEILGCGICDDEKWGNGIELFRDETTAAEIYDNIIIQAKRYGIHGHYETSGNNHKRNLIGDCGIGEAGGVGLIEGTGEDANIYHANVSDFGFKTWSNDGNYSNDDFSFPTQQAKGEISNVDYPASVNHSDNFDINVVVKNIGAMSGIFKTQIMVDGTIVSTSNEFILINGETSPSMINQFIAPPSGDSMNIDVKCIRII